MNSTSSPLASGHTDCSTGRDNASPMAGDQPRPVHPQLSPFQEQVAFVILMPDDRTSSYAAEVRIMQESALSQHLDARNGRTDMTGEDGDARNGHRDMMGDAYIDGGFGAVPASSKAIDSLPEATLGEIRETECVVCLDTFKTEDKVRKMPCSHGFHESCIFEWLRISRICPHCRFALAPRTSDP